MILTGHQPNYLPYIGFFHKIAASDAFVVVDHVQFVKRGPFGWMHRNRIRTPEGWMWLTVPVLTKGKFHQAISETVINNQEPWTRKHWRSLETHYRHAPFFKQYSGFFEETYAREWELLAELNTAIIRGVLDMLGIRVPMTLSSTMAVTRRSTELVCELCRKTGADSYLSGIHGRDYLKEGAFADCGVKLLYQDFRHPVYRQARAGAFVANLSIVDLLFNCGPDSLAVLKGHGSGGFVDAAEDPDEPLDAGESSPK
jgi:hypothetical protein